MGTFRRVISLSLAAGLVVAPLTAAGASTSVGSDGGGFGSTGGGVGLIRVNQLGYSGAAGAAAYLMTSEAAVGARFEVVDKRGRRVLSGRVGQDAGAWNAKYQHVYRLDLSKVRWPGSYRVKVAGWPGFTVAIALDSRFALAGETISGSAFNRSGCVAVAVRGLMRIPFVGEHRRGMAGAGGGKALWSPLRRSLFRSWA